MRRIGLALAALAVVAFAGFWVASGPGTANAPGPGDVDIALGADLYAESCASCHGAKLEGQPDWRSTGADGRLSAPPHDETGHTWHHGDRILFDYVKLGGNAALAKSGVDGFDSGMPGFADSLTDPQIWDIIAYLKSTWPDRIRAVQAERSSVE